MAYKCPASLFRKERRSIIYLDEACINTSYSKNEVFYCDRNTRNYNTTSSDGQRRIVVHAGGEFGFVHGALQIFNQTDNAFGLINGTKFANWYKVKLLPNLQPNSVVVMDNASYHSVQVDRLPNLSARKTDIQEWLRNNAISFSESSKKHDCIALVEQHTLNREPKYIIDEITKQAGHTLLRLPPYHSHLNPIETVWAQVKRNVSKNNGTDKFGEAEELINDAINRVTAEQWRSACKKIVNIEKDYLFNDSHFSSEMCGRWRTVG